MENTHTHLFAFTLGREWRLSLAELIAVWGIDSYQTHSEEVALFQIVGYSDEQIQKRFMTLGGSIRVIKIVRLSDEKRFATDVIEMIRTQYADTGSSGKITFALGAYGIDYRLSDIGLRIKKTLQEKGLSARLANTENKNINAASFKKDKFSKTKNEYNLIVLGAPYHVSRTEHGVPSTQNQEPITYIGYTLACQDIDAYANRDTTKVRDMVVGMMPPKLVQMMINISTSSPSSPLGKGEKKEGLSVYDPFCGLGTTLIESANMGILEIAGSDLSPDMVRASRESMEGFIKTELMWQERIRTAGGIPSKDFGALTYDIFQLDAQEVDQAFIKHKIQKDATLISEGYLGEVMGSHDISLDRVKSERRKLAELYTRFFRGLKQVGYTGTIVMSFPFWNIRGTYSYFTEIYDILEQAGFQSEPLLPSAWKLNTMKGSLLYRRDSQTVGREIVKIVRKTHISR